MAGSDDDPLFGDMADAELDLGPRAPRAKAGASRGPQEPDAGLDLQEPDGGGLDLLDLESVPTSGALELESLRAPAAPPGVAEAAAMPTAAEAVQDSIADTPIPAPLPAHDVAHLAGYGPPPGFFGAIPYAIHVYARRKELLVLVQDARRHRKAAEEVRHTVAAAETSSDADATDRVARADGDLAHRRRREDLLRTAADSYDKPAVYQGAGLLGGAAVVVLIFVLFVLGRAIF